MNSFYKNLTAEMNSPTSNDLQDLSTPSFHDDCDMYPITPNYNDEHHLKVRPFDSDSKRFECYLHPLLFDSENILSSMKRDSASSSLNKKIRHLFDETEPECIYTLRNQDNEPNLGSHFPCMPSLSLFN